MYNTIYLDKVNLHFEEKKVLHNISFKVKPNIPKCIVGKGLSGKSTILKSIIGLIPLKTKFLATSSPKPFIPQIKTFD